MNRIFLDTDLFVRKLRYPHDLFSKENSLFLEKVKCKKIKGATSIFNVLEVCGILSFNLTVKALTDLYTGFGEHFGVKIFFPADENVNLQYDYARVFEKIRSKQSLGDAQVSYVVERFSNLISAFVSWNARHFEGKLSVPVMTPEGFLKG
jgi:hypothetical protein